jgi:hypothetical protein
MTMTVKELTKDIFEDLPSDTQEQMRDSYCLTTTIVRIIAENEIDRNSALSGVFNALQFVIVYEFDENPNRVAKNTAQLLRDVVKSSLKKKQEKEKTND